MNDPELAEIQTDLSIKEVIDANTVGRRTFLKLLASGIAISAMPNWLQGVAAAAPSLGATDGVLIAIQLGGGNDGLNTVIPTGMARYYDLRKSLAISAGATLPLSSGLGLHPSLKKLKQRFDAGEVAIVQGVGLPANGLSHFNSTASWMTGWAPNPTASLQTGWLGRYIDELGTDPLYGLNVGTTTPLHLVGTRNLASSILPGKNGFPFGPAPNAAYQREASALKSLGSVSTGRGSLQDYISQTQATSLDIGNALRSCYPDSVPSGPLSSQLGLVANLINANLGTRIYGVSLGSFDTHDNQAVDHTKRLDELDAAIEEFYRVLAPQYAGRVTLMTFSEFGRRAEVNSSLGTDHGTSSQMFLIGKQVRGGLYGAQPSLTDLDSNSNLKTEVTFHQVYSNVVDEWLQADSSDLLGSTFSSLHLFKGAPTGTGSTTPSTPVNIISPAPVTPILSTVRPISFPRGYRMAEAGGGVTVYGGAEHYGNTPRGNDIAAFAVTPDQRGYWLASKAGAVFSFGNAPFHGGANTFKLNSSIVGMTSSPTGNGYWLLAGDGGIFTYGDAAFYGSTGGIRLNKPVVGLASTPDGKGYWLVASDGGIFAFGSAPFYGSTGSIKLNQPIVGMAATPDGKGYWLVASDGGIFAFGNAAFYGSTGSIKLNQPIVGMSSTPTGKGYRLVARDGGIFCYGDATFEGSRGSTGTTSPVIAIAT